MAPEPLAQVLRQLPKTEDKNLLTAGIPFADAGVYRISETCALVQSVDFFTPIVDDPATFGRIAAANAISDIYAMGGKPITALNMVGFPKCLDHDILVEILKGGAEKAAEAGVVIVGGHTVEDDEPKYGLAVTGLVHPKKMISTEGARAGDRLVLTKPLGTGILATALKGEVISETEMAEAIAGMQTLNRAAAEAMLEVGVSACTDITGFGLLGHALEMAQASSVSIEIWGDDLPLYTGAREMAAMGLIPAGNRRNRDYYLPKVLDGHEPSVEVIDLVCDPQTSGGLLIAVAAEKAQQLIRCIETRGEDAWQVGEVVENRPGTVRIK